MKTIKYPPYSPQIYFLQTLNSESSADYTMCAWACLGTGHGAWNPPHSEGLMQHIGVRNKFTYIFLIKYGQMLTNWDVAINKCTPMHDTSLECLNLEIHFLLKMCIKTCRTEK